MLDYPSSGLIESSLVPVEEGISMGERASMLGCPSSELIESSLVLKCAEVVLKSRER